MTVKGNMPTLFRQLKKLPWPQVPSVSTVTKDHGRRARRTVKVILAPAWIEFEGAAQVAQLRRTVTKKGRKTVEVVYVITSDRRADPATLAAWVKGHWEIENKLHTEPEEPPGNLLALALLAPVVGAAAGFLGAAFRLALEYINLWRNILIVRAHNHALAGFLLVTAVCRCYRNSSMACSPIFAKCFRQWHPRCRDRVERRTGADNVSPHPSKVRRWIARNRLWSRLGT